MATGTEVGSVYLRLALESDVNQQVQQATDEVGKSASDSFAGMFKKAFSVAAIAVVISKVKEFTAEAEQLYQIQADAELKLETIMRQRMKSTDDEIQHVKDLASEIQGIGVIGDEVTLSGAQQLATFLNSEESLKSLLPAMDNLLAQQKGLNATAGDAINIGNMFGKVMQGQTAALSRVGITFSEAQEEILKYGTEEERAATLAQVITDNVGNMNEVLADTPSGKIQQLNNRLGDVKERFGAISVDLKSLFVPLLNRVAGLLESIASWAEKALYNVKEFFVGAGVLDESVLNTDTQSKSEKLSLLNEERQGILDAIDELKKSQTDDVADAIKETTTTKDSGPQAASFDQFNILRFNDATKKLLDASENLNVASGNISDSSNYDEQLQDLLDKLASIDEQITIVNNEPEEQREPILQYTQNGTPIIDDSTLKGKIQASIWYWANEIWPALVEDWESFGEQVAPEIQQAAEDVWLGIKDLCDIAVGVWNGDADKVRGAAIDLVDKCKDFFNQVFNVIPNSIEEWFNGTMLGNWVYNKTHVFHEEKRAGALLDMNNYLGDTSIMQTSPNLLYSQPKVSAAGSTATSTSPHSQAYRERQQQNQTINLTAPIYIDGEYITDANIRNINTQTQLRGKQQIR